MVDRMQRKRDPRALWRQARSRAPERVVTDMNNLKCSGVRRGPLWAVVAVFSVFVASGASTSRVEAACQNGHAACGGGDVTRTSALTVKHCVMDGSVCIPVEPDNTDTWTVTANYSTSFNAGVPGCSCQDNQAQATVTVSWNGTGWTAVCTAGCNALAGPIFGVSVCNVTSCTGGDGPHGAEYMLLVDLGAVNGACDVLAFNLRAVSYVAADVDDGLSWDESTCESIEAVTPTTQSWSTTDTGTFECAISCNNAGASLTITYD